MSKYILLLGLGKVSFNKTSRNGLKVAKAGHKSEGHMGLMADSYDSERGGVWWLSGIMADWHNG